ncbi:MAG: UDP-N-acetylmuramoyl-tripeptide--D-alanyl-D-alanine ligase, partial [Actinobacteria bacterium]|nr:UDP-N-acetylmuramoyl-tripeptide--D-alanyl-D-alanine ligase [Actinomycetota bacterium]
MKLGQKIDLSHFIKWSGSENISSSQLKNMKDAAIEAVSTDSRTIEPGDFFIPLKGPSFDGHDFICEAVAGGCCGFVIESDKTGIYEAVVEKIGKPAVDKLVILKADDNLVFLENLAGSYLKSFSVVTIGITGSAGKTSTKDFIVNILSKSFDIKYTPKNYNTEIGVSLSALEVNHSTKFFISEMGMRAKGQIRKLAEMIDPAIGVITTVGPSHLEFFNNIEEIALAKAELADFLSLKGGVLFLNGDDEWAAFIAGRTAAKIFLFGKNNRFDFNFQEYDADDFGRYSFTFFEKDRKIADIKLSSSGYQSIYNAGLAASVCTYLGADADLVKKGLELGQTSEGRMNVFKKGDIIIINDCYNASPLSMKCAIETLNLVSGRNRSRSVALLADMFELG